MQGRDDQYQLLSPKASLSPSGIASIHLFKAAVLGYTNAANASLMDDSCVSGISFKSLLPLVHMKAGGKTKWPSSCFIEAKSSSI